MSDRDPQTYAIIGAAMNVHTELGKGFLESVYQEALAIEFRTQGIPFEREVKLPVFYKGQVLATSFRVDFICYGEVVVELKAQKAIGGPDEAQVLNYLRASNLGRGLLLNFGETSLKHVRFVN
ncbi:MAG: GxxExxY protein [Bacteroidetes bacterium]|nr:GxxExxY protein [Bacteroidota bacterium]MBS1942119.1 GxxExxY protein [Bacteroidota bacterium]